MALAVPTNFSPNLQISVDSFSVLGLWYFGFALVQNVGKSQLELLTYELQKYEFL